MTFDPITRLRAVAAEGEAADLIQIGRGDLRALVAEHRAMEPAVTADAYMASNRALNWRTAELRFHGHEPIRLPTNAPHHPPEGFDFGVPAA